MYFHPNSLAGIPQSLRAMGYEVIEMWPKPPQPRIPEHLPDAVSRAYLSAERNFAQAGMEDASAAMYGRALDIGTKIMAPDLPDRTMLAERIRKLKERGRITADLAAWADDVRLARNIALHEIDGTSREELVAMRGFTEMMLTYLFSLPAMLEARKEAAADGGTAPST